MGNKIPSSNHNKHYIVDSGNKNIMRGMSWVDTFLLTISTPHIKETPPSSIRVSCKLLIYDDTHSYIYNKTC